MINIKILVNKLPMPKPTKTESPCACAKKLIKELERDDLEEDARKATWQKLKAMYESDASKQDKKLMKILTPAIRKYAQYDNEGVDLSTDFLAEDN